MVKKEVEEKGRREEEKVVATGAREWVWQAAATKCVQWMTTITQRVGTLSA